MKKSFLFALLLFVVSSCVLSTEPDPLESELVGKWLLFERGYSPGYDYFVDPIPPSPPKYYTFQANGEFSTNVDESSHLNRYRFGEDGRGKLVVLYSDRRKEKAVQEQLTFTFEFNDDGATLILRAWCFEGCHLGLSRVK